MKGYRIHGLMALVVAAAMLVALAGCDQVEDTPMPGGASPAMPQEPAAGPADAPPADLVAGAEGPVPDFLDAGQQLLYRRAKTAFMEFTLDNMGFGSGGADGPTLEQGDMQYYRANGDITTWRDFEAAMLGLFTPDYFAELNRGVSYTDDQGVYHERLIFTQSEDGALYYAGSGRGGNVTFMGPEAFALVSQTEERIEFHVIGTYDELVEDDKGEWVHSGNPTERRQPIVMERGPDGWRFSRFSLAY